MKIAPVWTDLDRLLTDLGLSPTPFQLVVNRSEWPVIERELGLDEVEEPKPGDSFRIRGEPVFLYIRDTWLKHDTIEQAVEHPEAYTRIHLTECQKISEMRRQKRFERYVVTNRFDRPLRMILNDRQHDRAHEVELELRTCKYCLQAINWEGYAECPRIDREKIWLSFNRKAFLERYSPTFASLPSGHDQDPNDDYPENWTSIRLQALHRAHFTCQRCRVKVPRERRHLLDVHHVNGKKSDCHQTNLVVLCKLCHTAEPMHSHYDVKPDQATEIRRLRREQGLGQTP